MSTDTADIPDSHDRVLTQTLFEFRTPLDDVVVEEKRAIPAVCLQIAESDQGLRQPLLLRTG